MISTSTAEQVRRDVYDQAVAALHRADPNAVPVAQFGDPYAIPMVSNQARNTAAPADPASSPEGMLFERVHNMQGAISKLVAEAKRNAVPVSTPPKISGDDLRGTLRALNDYHDRLEKKVTYYSQTTREQRAIDQLMSEVAQLQKAFLAQDVLLKVLIAKSGEPK
jgi:hypothetical protein